MKLPNTDRFGPKGPFRITFIRKGHGERRCAAWWSGSKRIPPYTSRPAGNKEEGAERPRRRSWRKEKGERPQVEGGEGGEGPAPARHRTQSSPEQVGMLSAKATQYWQSTGLEQSSANQSHRVRDLNEGAGEAEQELRIRACGRERSLLTTYWSEST
jgi:hypothetical protein